MKSFIKKLHVSFIIVMFLIAFGVIIISSCKTDDKNKELKYNQSNESTKVKENKRCIYRNENFLVETSDLKGIIEFGEYVNIQYSYYNCNNIYEGDIIAYTKSGYSEPMFRIVKAIPGDTFEIVQGNETWHILVNDIVLTNSENKPYKLDLNSRIELLKYQKAYMKRFPERRYLVLTNNVEQDIDITSVDIIEVTDIEGRVKYTQKINKAVIDDYNISKNNTYMNISRI